MPQVADKERVDRLRLDHNREYDKRHPGRSEPPPPEPDDEAKK